MGHLFEPSNLSGHEWIDQYAQSPCTVAFEDYIRIYFSSRTKPCASRNYVSRLAYIDVSSEDLFSILKVSDQPILELGKPGEFDEFGTYPVSIIRNRDEIVAYYAGWTRCESVPFNAAIGLAKSYDNGYTFQRMGCGPVLGFAPDEPFILGSPRVKRFNDCWYLWYASGRAWVREKDRLQPVYKIRMAKSLDGLEWQRVGKDIIPNVLEENECQASAEVIYSAGLYHMFFSYRYNFDFHLPDRSYRIGYAYSEDLEAWTRDDSKAGISPSKEGWDSQSVSYPHIFQKNEIIYMLYQGNDIGRNGFGLAKLEHYQDPI